ncbi:hypothetical protein EEL34_14830 [Muribaculaceae bacterium Isolate-039 (Harlan)]|nr:hypothetical protein [Muribaculaceae bacterium S4]ROS81322.1 hypothetical protein EEL34_14830 [Muribaculaceae bacterium Isolate-039 (Harlan)]
MLLTDLIVFDSLNSYVDNPLAIGGSYENKQAIRCSGWLELCVELIAFEILFQSVLNPGQRIFPVGGREMSRV